MDDLIDIAEVARLTALTARALRFYEARGLVRPLRTASGRRCYGRGELARLNAIVALKRAGFSLTEIGRMLGRGTPDLRRMVSAQIGALDDRLSEIEAARALLLSVQSRIDRGEPIDVATLCSLIRQGNDVMEAEKWKTVTDQYMGETERADWDAAQAKMPADFDQEAYSRQWKELSARIEAAMPIDPESDVAQGFVDQWFALLKPFSAIATPAMWQGTQRMYDDRANWKADADPGFSTAVWAFIQEATKKRLAKGGTIDGPAWMTGTKA
ncbi:MerR family transcriptional regulator [Sphingomonas crocodyli]|uniref:MerR family transcriptional regulator n=1 Tax=Sphingomonas crocodyli TaxID=1979270 RepID=A0A437M4X8_9SPHN|nr:MerR family transcriptional regulator [Sphingomonas crocodyli]RVT92780.1 MerR family transcriptional regulator [Sphingomonas crocodyli]